MKAGRAALIFALVAVGLALGEGFLSHAGGRLLAQDAQPAVEPAQPAPSPSPTPAPSPTVTPPPAPPAPAPAPTPAQPPATSKPKPAPKAGAGAAPIDVVYPLDYKSVVERLNQEPKNPALLNELGDILMQYGRPQQAVTQYQKAIRAQPDLAIAWNNLGVARTAQGKFADGENAYRRAIKLNPAYALAYYNLGANFDQRKNFDQALVYYQRAIEIDPGLLDVRNNPQIASNRHIPEILIQSYLDKGGSVVLAVQSMYPPKPKKKPKP